jgi:TPR repeat protein
MKTPLRTRFISGLAAGLVAGALAFAAPAAADYWSDFEAAIEAYATGRFGDAAQGFGEFAARGDHRSQYWLGMMYYEGKGVPRDPLRAYMWLSLAAERGNRAAGIGLDAVVRRLSEDELGEARAMAADWRPGG